MTTATIDTATEMYRDGKPVIEITAATGLTEHQIAAAVTLAEQPAGPNLDVVVKPKATPTGPAADSIEALLAWAEKHPAKGVRGQAGRIRESLAQLRTRRDGDQAVTAAEAEVRHLEEQLTAARTKLRQARAGTPTQAADYTGPWPADPTPQQLRAWAKQAGVPCNQHGSVTRTVADAYHQARTAATA
ncbi:hypothetical protein AB0O82_32755 [Kitasatospora sp. NPDC088264]|uniref:hypothetical protein n=1 Tax=Kitasatospora sp. NPDC088264 TaxID=3155296 RepID=UPI003421084B